MLRSKTQEFSLFRFYQDAVVKVDVFNDVLKFYLLQVKNSFKFDLPHSLRNHGGFIVMSMKTQNFAENEIDSCF
jgi:hypothetical protein